MRAVLYAYDLWKRGTVRLAIMEEVAYSFIAQPLPTKVWSVVIHAEKLVLHGQESLLLFTADEATALRLKTAFLPGQQAEVQRRSRDAFAHGFLKALSQVGKI